MIASLCRFLLRFSGWSIATEGLPLPKKCVLIGYPHTSNWDFILAMLVKGALGMQFNWVAKHTLFRWPLGPFMRAMGGIGVDRANTQGFTAALAEAFQHRAELVIVITPEGTRTFRPFWKSGFYHLARAADLPIVMGYIDAPTKRIGFGPTLPLSGDQEADLAAIRAFYANKVGIHPKDAGSIQFLPR